MSLAQQQPVALRTAKQSSLDARKEQMQYSAQLKPERQAAEVCRIGNGKRRIEGQLLRPIWGAACSRRKTYLGIPALVVDVHRTSACGMLCRAKTGQRGESSGRHSGVDVSAAFADMAGLFALLALGAARAVAGVAFDFSVPSAGGTLHDSASWLGKSQQMVWSVRRSMKKWVVEDTKQAAADGQFKRDSRAKEVRRGRSGLPGAV